MPLLVAIDLPPDTPPEYAAAVTGSCNAALGEDACASGTEGPWVAVVRWDDPDYRTLRIELQPGNEESSVETRVVAFTPADPPRQRWASAGLVVAALVSRRAASAPQPPPPPPRELPPVAPPIVPPPPPYRPWVRVDVGGVTGPGLDEGPWRGGGMVRVSGVPIALPFAVQAEARFAARGGDPVLQWLDTSLGFTMRLGRWDSPVAAELRADGVMEHVWLTAKDEDRDERETARRSRWGGRLGAELVAALEAPAGFFLGVEATLLRPEVVIAVGGEDRGREPALRYSGVAGLRLSF